MPEQADILRDLVGILYRRRAIVLLAVLLTTGVATIAAFVASPAYEATSTVIADKNPPIVLLSNSGNGSNLLQQPVAEAPDAFTLTELAKSEAVRDRALAVLARTLGARSVAGILRGSVRVQQVRTTDLIQISVRDRDPNVAAAVANAVAQSVVAMDLNARRRLATRAREFIGAQLRLSARALHTSENALTAFKSESHDVALSEETRLNLERLSGLEQQLTNVRLQQQEVQPEVVASTAPGGQPGQGGLDPVVTTLRSQMVALEVEYSGLRKQFTPLHPAVISTQAKIDETQRRLNAELASRRAALAAREQDLIAEVSRIEDTLMRVPTREAVLARLTRDAKEAERDYLLLAERFQEARIAEGSIGSALRVVDVARAPSAPVGGKRRTNLAVGVVLGLLLGIGGAWAMEQTDETVKSPRDVERLLGAPVLGTAPMLMAADAAPVLLTQLDRRSGESEAFRLVRTHLLHLMEGRQSKCVLVTSVQPDETKSVVVANLAISVAQTDRRVWLVECDLRRPVLARLFPEADSPGMADVLSGLTVADRVARPTAQARLQCVVGGAGVAHAAELLDTQRLTQFVAQARACADVVLLDSPALGALADAEIVALQSDGALLIVQMGRTSREALALAQHRLQDLGVPVIGAVLAEVAQHPSAKRPAGPMRRRMPWPRAAAR